MLSRGKLLALLARDKYIKELQRAQVGELNAIT